jgi:hypothetical protein
MSDEKVIPTPDGIRAKFETVRQHIGRMPLSLDGVIDHYPIGRRERGRFPSSELSGLTGS